MLRNKRKNAHKGRFVRFGWGGWIRTNEMAESESAALPLGDTPLELSHYAHFLKKCKKYL